MLSLMRHPNLVHLIGYCAEGTQRLLVYEYMPLGSLEDHLLGNIFNVPSSYFIYDTQMFKIKPYLLLEEVKYLDKGVDDTDNDMTGFDF